MSALSELINKGLADRGWSGWSLRTLSAKTDERLSHGSIAKYRNGTHGVPDEETVEALSELTGISVERIRRAAGLPEGERDVYQPPPESARLDRRQRHALDELIRSFVTTQEGSNAASQEQRPETGSTADDPEAAIAADRAARAAEIASQVGINPITDAPTPRSKRRSVSVRDGTTTERNDATGRGA